MSEVNSDPVDGWASWVNEQDVLIAFMHPMAAEEGWARVGSRAPGAANDDPEAVLDNPEAWKSLAKLIHAVAVGKPVPDMRRESY